MTRWLSLFACLYLIFCAALAHADTPVTLKPRVEATGAAITMGDVFNGAGDAASRPIAPAPAAGQVSTLSTEFLLAATSSAGLTWTPPAGVTLVRVTHPAGARAFVPASVATPIADTSSAAGPSTPNGDIAVHRGQTVLLQFDAPGVSLAMQARATSDGAIGQTIRVLNTSSNRTVEAVITGPGAARVGAP
ncbi:MAG: flagellar basal body P-ring formation chaperone FlgA [Pseudomonadota bacterium]